MEKNVYFISGIDTDAGKSYCTAYYACQPVSYTHLTLPTT